METFNQKKFERLNFILKIEIFSFIKPIQIIYDIMLVCEKFYFAIKNIK